jgi:hypothetical protein
MVNLIATNPGYALFVFKERIDRDYRHYDTKLLPRVTFRRSHDAGSSTAFLIEIARVRQGTSDALTMN